MFFKEAKSFAFLLYFSASFYWSEGLFNCPADFEVLEVGMTYEDRIVATDVHNACRRHIANGEIPGQPKACDMMEMCYDMGLEQEARKFVAETCNFEHVKIPDNRWFAVGQNLYLWKGTNNNPKPNWEVAIKGWFEEYKLNYTFPIAQHGTGHYTQVVWSKSVCVGCSYIYYKNPSQRLGYQKLYVCNYGPAGNVRTQSPYQINCSKQCTLNNGLCVSSNNQCSGASKDTDFSYPSSEDSEYDVNDI